MKKGIKAKKKKEKKSSNKNMAKQKIATQTLIS